MPTAREKVITCIGPGCNLELYDYLKTLCEKKGWSRHTLYRMQFPFEYKGYLIDKKKIIR